MSHPRIFDRQRVSAHRERASQRFGDHDFLLREITERLCDRLDDISRTFPLALDLGAHNGMLAQVLGGRRGVQTLVQTDLSHKMISTAQGCRVVADEEFLPFADNSFDLVMSSGSLHWVNDLPGTLVQIRRILKPDGLFLAVLPGGNTLRELRQAFEQAEQALIGGISPRVSPFIDVRDAGMLLQRAGFALPVVDAETLTVAYEHPLKLLHDLRGMGESNALIHSTKTLTPAALIPAMFEHYIHQFTDDSGRIPATFELVTLTAWKPHASQPQPAKRGSGKVSLADAVGKE